MKWLLAFHIIFVVAWFAALFYLPRLFVYHASAEDQIGRDRFKIMEYKLYYYIMWPAGVLATAFGFAVMACRWDYYNLQIWLHLKIVLVGLLWLYHLFCGWLVWRFKHDANPFSERFYRFFNEFPTVILITVVILAVVKPFGITHFFQRF